MTRADIYALGAIFTILMFGAYEAFESYHESKACAARGGALVRSAGTFFERVCVNTR